MAGIVPLRSDQTPTHYYIYGRGPHRGLLLPEELPGHPHWRIPWGYTEHFVAPRCFGYLAAQKEIFTCRFLSKLRLTVLLLLLSMLVMI